MRKLLTVFVFMLLFSSALAAITVTWTTPSASQQFNNTPANRRTIDLNFTVTDNNASVRDLNLDLYYYTQHGFASQTAIVTDQNIFDWNANPTTAKKCHGLNWTSFTCNYKWTMPLNTTMGEGTYRIDANVVDWTDSGSAIGLGDGSNADKNTDILIIINNSISTKAVVKSLLSALNVILAAAGLIVLLGILFVFGKIDANMLLGGIAVVVVVAIGAMLVGTITAVW